MFYKIFPQLNNIDNLSGGKYHNESPLKHMLSAFEYSCDVTDDIFLRLICFLHDIGKNYTISYKDDGIHFYGHDIVGAKIIREFLVEYKFSGKQVKRGKYLVRNHMIGYLNFGITKLIERFTEIEDHASINDLWILMYCDRNGNSAKQPIKFREFLDWNATYRTYNNLKMLVPFRTHELNSIEKNKILEDMAKKMKSGKDIGNALTEHLKHVQNKYKYLMVKQE